MGRAESWCNSCPKCSYGIRRQVRGERGRTDAASGVECVNGTGARICKASSSGTRTALESRCPVQAHTADADAACFSVDGSKFASGSFDGACKVWDSSTGALLKRK